MARGPNLTEPGGEPLGTTARRALMWSVGNNVFGRVGTTLVGIVLARILVPEQYGIYAVALVALNVLLSVNELGVSQAVVRWPGDVGRIAPTVKTLALASSVLLWILAFLAAPVFASAVNVPEATPVIRLLTLAILVDAVTAVPAALITREFMQRERTIVDMAGFFASAIVAICLAVTGHGVYALVWSALVGNFVHAVLLVRAAPRHYPFGLRRSVLPELLSFGLPLALASLLLIALMNVDYVVVGRSLGAKELGFYLLAFNLAMWPVNMFSAPARRVSLPLFARLHAGETGASNAFVPVCAMLLLATLPACVMLAIFAQPLVETVYGEKWLPAAAVLPWLMVLALVRVFGELVYDFLVALGSSIPNMALQGIWLVALLVTLPIAVRAGGIRGVAMAHAGVAVLVVVPCYGFVLRRAGVSLRLMAARLARPFAAAAVAAAAGVAIGLVVPDGFLVATGLECLLVALVYAAIVYPLRTTLKPAIPGPA